LAGRIPVRCLSLGQELLPEARRESGCWRHWGRIGLHRGGAPASYRAERRRRLLLLLVLAKMSVVKDMGWLATARCDCLLALVCNHGRADDQAVRTEREKRASAPKPPNNIQTTARGESKSERQPVVVLVVGVRRVYPPVQANEKGAGIQFVGRGYEPLKGRAPTFVARRHKGRMVTRPSSPDTVREEAARKTG